MQFRLRTLLIVLADGPVVLAVLWWLRHDALLFVSGVGTVAAYAISFFVASRFVDLMYWSRKS